MIPRHAYEPRDGTDEHMCVCGSHFFDSIHFTSSGFARDAWESYKGTRQSYPPSRFPHPYRPDESGRSGGYLCVCGLAPIHERHHFPWMVTRKLTAKSKNQARDLTNLTNDSNALERVAGGVGSKNSWEEGDGPPFTGEGPPFDGPPHDFAVGSGLYCAVCRGKFFAPVHFDGDAEAMDLAMERWRADGRKIKSYPTSGGMTHLPDVLRRPPRFKTLEEADAWMTRMAATAEAR